MPIDGVRFPDEMVDKGSSFNDADKVLISDSQDSKKAKWYTFASLKTWLYTILSKLDASNLTTENVSAWQDKLDIAILKGSINDLTEGNAYTVDINSYSVTSANTLNLPDTNKVGILDCVVSDNSKYLQYKTFNGSIFEYWNNHFDGSVWSGWLNLNSNISALDFLDFNSNEINPNLFAYRLFADTTTDTLSYYNTAGDKVDITGDQDLSNYVDKSSTQTIDGVKTFASSPIVPTPTTDNQAANKIYVDNLTKPETLETSGWWSTLNTVSENILALDLNRTQLFIPRAGAITKIKFYIESLGANLNSCKINFTQNGLDLLASNHTLTADWNTLTTLQNNTVSENIELKLAVRTASGSDDIGDFKIQITLS